MVSSNSEVNSAALAPTDSQDLQGNDTIVTLTRGLTIRHWRWTDVPNTVKYCDHDNMWINQFDRWPRPYNEDAAYRWINITKDKEQFIPTGDDVDAATAPKITGKYVIALDDELIGSIGVNHQPGDIMRRFLNVGYWVGEEHWGKGIAPEALKGFVPWLWETFGWCVRIEAAVFAWNEKYSGRVLDKAGFTRQCQLRAGVFKNGLITDVVIYDLVRDGVVSVMEGALR